MSITVIKEGNALSVVKSSLAIPEGVPLELFTRDELVDPWTAAAIESAFFDQEDWGSSLDGLVVREEETKA